MTADRLSVVSSANEPDTQDHQANLQCAPEVEPTEIAVNFHTADEGEEGTEVDVRFHMDEEIEPVSMNSTIKSLGHIQKRLFFCAIPEILHGGKVHFLSESLITYSLSSLGRQYIMHNLASESVETARYGEVIPIIDQVYTEQVIATPEGDLLEATDNELIRWWNLLNGIPIQQHIMDLTRPQNKDRLLQMKILNNQLYLVYEGLIQQIDLDNKEVVNEWHILGHRMTSIDFDEHQRLIVISTSQSPKMHDSRIARFEKDGSITRFEASLDSSVGIVSLPGGRIAAISTCSADLNAIEIWDINKGKKIKATTAFNYPEILTASPDNKLLVVRAEDALHFVETETYKVVHTEDLPGRDGSLTWNPRNHKLMTQSLIIMI